MRLALVITAALVFAAGMKAQASDSYCAFEVVVRSPAGSLLEEQGVEGVDEDGSVFGVALTDKRGVARLCDAPARLIQIRVGGNRCSAVTVRYLKRYWLRTRQVFVTYENCAGEEWAIPFSCRLTIRVRDESASGNAVEGVHLHGLNVSTAAPEPKESDRFGRIFQSVKFGAKSSGWLEKDGYFPLAIAEGCGPGEGVEKDVTVVMLRRPAR
ncbi:hypothetical protein [Paludibaculum fermentans]|uniref:hypothetical protein n=1 Tax=Paludibaculum fermentans TaxID=1473598 RepID=UPI003EBABFEA